MALAGCARKVRPFVPREAIAALARQAQAIRTERGRAWTSIHWRVPDGPSKGSEEKISFPAVIAVDRTHPEAPLLRLEAMDPFGSTHDLLILDGQRRFTWIDYDHRRIYEMSQSWAGVPLSRLPELVLGLVAGLSGEAEGHVSAETEGFELRQDSNVFHYLMTWIDPGPRLALAGIDGELAKRAEKYVVRYSKYLDKADFYLPQEVKIQGFSRGSSDPGAQIDIAWRERRWNEDIPADIFTPPRSGTEGFEHQKL